MNLVIRLVLPILLLNPVFTDAQELTLFSSFSNGAQSNFKITEDLARKQPEWNEIGEPPLSITEAIQIARNQYKSSYDESSPSLEEIEIDKKSHNCFNGQKCIHPTWYIQVTLKGEYKDTFVLLMDGTIVPPQRK